MSEQIPTPTLQTIYEIDPTEIKKESIVDERFEIYGLLASTAVSRVYGAYDTADDDANVALKVHSNPDPDTQIRNHREQQILEDLGHLNHPNIVSLVAAGLYETEKGTNPYIAMEYQAFGTLADNYNRQNAEQVLGHLASAAVGLGAAHRAGILHRDIKPGNILVGARGTKVGDFGLAIHESDRSWDPLCRIAKDQKTFIFGTPGYVAPEIFEGELSTPMSDMYSLGSTAIAALIGEARWNEEIAEHTGYDVASISLQHAKRALELHPEALSVISAALEDDPGQRPSDDDFIEGITARMTPELKIAA